jgi:hypothetical protein
MHLTSRCTLPADGADLDLHAPYQPMSAFKMSQHACRERNKFTGKSRTSWRMRLGGPEEHMGPEAVLIGLAGFGPTEAGEVRKLMIWGHYDTS